MGQEKIANPTKGRLILRALAGGANFLAAESSLSRDRELEEQAHALNQRFAAIEHARMRPVQDGVRYARPPIVIPAPVPGWRRWDGDDVPVGLDVGMVRLASVAEAVGREMAKEGGLMSQAAGWVTKKLPSLAGAAQKAAPQVGKVDSWLDRAGIGSVQGLKRTALGLGAGAAALYGGSKLLGGAKKVMSHEPEQNKRYGVQDYGGSRTAYGINQFGYPDLTAPYR